MTQRFTPGQYILRTGDTYSKAVIGGTYVVVDQTSEGLRIATMTGERLAPRFAAEKFRACTEIEIDRIEESRRPTDPAFRRDGLSREQARVLASELSAPVRLKRPTPSVRYDLRKNPPVRKPTVHPVPVGWKYSAEQGDGKEFDVLVRSRPAGWSPF